MAVADGDTFTLLENGKQWRIRVYAIDAPEKGMPYYKAARKYLSDLCFGRRVRIQPTKKDRYGRLVASVTLPDGTDLAAQMIRAGYAWHYKHYSADRVLAGLETHAKHNRHGLWRDDKALPPWEVRRLRRQGIPVKTGVEHPVDF